MIKEYLTWREFDVAVEQLAQALSSIKGVFNSIYGVPRGGLVLAVALSHKLNLRLLTDLVEMSPAVLVVDDISDSGKTLRAFSDCTTATIHITSFTGFIPDYYHRVRKEGWVVYPWESK